MQRNKPADHFSDFEPGIFSLGVPTRISGRPRDRRASRAAWEYRDQTQNDGAPQSYSCRSARSGSILHARIAGTARAQSAVKSIPKTQAAATTGCTGAIASR